MTRQELEKINAKTDLTVVFEKDTKCIWVLGENMDAVVSFEANADYQIGHRETTTDIEFANGTVIFIYPTHFSVRVK